MKPDTQPEVPEANAPMEYIIRVKGVLDLEWSDWFGDMQVAQDAACGETVLQGTVTDSAELYGLISRLRNLGLTLISVIPLDQGKT